jgi:hypothetical protein
MATPIQTNMTKKIQKKSWTSSHGFATVGFVEEDMKLRVIVKYKGSPVSNEEIDMYLKKLHEIYKLKKNFVIMYDVRNIGIVMPAQLMRQVTFMRARDDETKKLVERCAVVVSTQVARITISTLFKLKPPACPLQVLDSLDHAKNYLKTGQIP